MKKHTTYYILHTTRHSGFTLIELLVAATIIGILTVIAVVSYSSAQKRSRDGKRKADLEAIRGALEMRRADCGTYPLTADFSSYWGTSWSETCGTTNYTYMQKVPEDPKDPTYTYGYSSDGNTYTLCAYLESPGTSTCSGDCCSSCTGASCNYSVTQP